MSVPNASGTIPLATAAALAFLRSAGPELDWTYLSPAPVFPAGGASAAKPSLGVAGFRARAEEAGAPVYALGGVTAANVRELEYSGACGVAGVGAIQDAFA